jgi:urease accessory protein
MHAETLLAVLQLSDSAFPSGRYTLSHGLEAFAQAGLLDVPCSAATLEELLADCVRLGVAPSDGVARAARSHRTERSMSNSWCARIGG